VEAPATKPFRADFRASQARAEDGNLPTLREPFSPCGSAAAHELAPEWLGQISGRSGIPGSGPGPEHDTQTAPVSQRSVRQCAVGHFPTPGRSQERAFHHLRLLPRTGVSLGMSSLL